MELIDLVVSTFGLDGGAMFGIVPRPLWERTNPPDARNRIRMAARCLVLRFGDRVVLVDTGMGDKWSDKEASIYNVAHPDGGVHASLRARGVEPESITDVLMTHLHFDHAGGLTHLDGDGKVVAAFPDATHWVQRDNWVWAHAPTQRDAGSYRRENFEIFGQSHGPALELVEGATELFGAVEVIPSRGHTPGMQMVKVDVADGESAKTIVYVADLIPTATHVRIPYVMGYDCFPLTTVREKHALLSEAVRHDWILALEHDPDHGFVRVERRGPDDFRVAAAAGSWSEL